MEIASGYGQHAAHLARHLPDWVIIPSDVSRENLEVIEARRSIESLANFAEPLKIDAEQNPWPVAPCDAVLCINMIHISPWTTSEGLFRGAGRILSPGGSLLTYGPYQVAGAHTAPSNAAFDQRLRAMDPRFGIRDAEALDALAVENGLSPSSRIEMPANNLILAFGTAQAPALQT